MKIFYTILFFIDTLVLILLTFLFLKKLDNGISAGSLVIMLSGISCSIIFLGFFLFRFFKLPPSDHKN